jgi:hypothetical protein
VPYCSAYPRTDSLPSVRPGSPHPYSPDFAIADFCLFVRLKQQLFGRTLDSEENVTETTIEVLKELPKNEVKNVVLHWKKKCQRASDHN